MELAKLFLLAAPFVIPIVIEIARNACGTLDFDREDEMIELGRNNTQACLGFLT